MTIKCRVMTSTHSDLLCTSKIRFDNYWGDSRQYYYTVQSKLLLFVREALLAMQIRTHLEERSILA